ADPHRKRSPGRDRINFARTVGDPPRHASCRGAPRNGGSKVAKILPFLWYTKDAEEAAKFYCSLIPNSRVTAVNALPAESPSGPPGSVKIVDFVLNGQPFQAMTAGPLDDFNHAI